MPGSLLISRLGPRRALIAGLLLIGIASSLRGAGPSIAILFAMTLAMGVGVAVSQPAFPSLVREWFPARVGVATAVYSNGLLVGETIPASLTVPLLLPLVHGNWEITLVLWSIPVLVTAALFATLTRQPAPRAGVPPARWWPDWRDLRTWQIGLMMGCASAAYFGTNAFLPDYLRATGRSHLIGAALAAVNAAQLASSLLVIALSRRLMASRLPFLAAGTVIAGSVVGLIVMPGGWIVFWAGMIGFAAAVALILTLALPPLLAQPGDVHRLSAAIFTLLYGFTFVGPLVGGAAWDATGVPAAAFAAVGVGALIMLALAARLDLSPRSRATGVQTT